MLKIYDLLSVAVVWISSTAAVCVTNTPQIYVASVVATFAICLCV
jgi:hypothetical protein